MKLKHVPQALLLILLLSGSLSLSAAAQTRIATTDLPLQFCSADFLTDQQEEGVFITAVPDAHVAVIRWGQRVIRPGDALPVHALDQLTMQTDCVTAHDAVISYYTVSDGKASAARDMKLSILPRKNEPPTADAGMLETYKNIPNSGKLQASDPEGGRLTYRLEKAPKRGTVEIQVDGSYTYTPYENKVGKDSFTYTVTDEAGNVSEPAKITVEIKKPADAAAFSDMTGDPDAYAAMWMKDRGLYGGSTVTEHLCFGPEDPVSRGEFLVMTMKLVEAAPDETIAATGFADEESAPLWMQPYIRTALSNGMISGTVDSAGVWFRPNDPLTPSEAAVMLQNILQLPIPHDRPVFADHTQLPEWAQGAAAALAQADIHVPTDSAQETMTRRETADLLLQIDGYLHDASPTFYWVR